MADTNWRPYGSPISYLPNPRPGFHNPFGAGSVGGTVSELVNWIMRGYATYREHATPSLTAYTKQTNVMTRLYIENDILRDEICPPLVGMLNQLYVSYVLSALNLDTLCANGRTVREMLETVGTESYDLVDEIMKTFGSNNYNYSHEAGPVVDPEPATQRLPVGRIIELTMTGAVPGEIVEKKVSGARTEARDNNGRIIRNPDGTAQDAIDYHDPEAQMELTTKANTGTFQFKAYMYVQLVPYILSANNVNDYISANFVPQTKSRWNKFKAGEISFWNDFVFTKDLMKRQQSMLSKDKDGVITEMMTKNQGRLGRWFTGLLGVRGVSHNIANSIMICSKETFQRACLENNIRFDDYNQRQRYFNKTWSMIICVVDPMYNSVDMYFNGIDAKGTYTFDIVNKVGAKGKDSFDLKEIMGAFSQGISPRF